MLKARPVETGPCKTVPRDKLLLVTRLLRGANPPNLNNRPGPVSPHLLPAGRVIPEAESVRMSAATVVAASPSSIR